MFSCVERLNISLTYALARRLSIPATSHQFKPLSPPLHLCLGLFQCILYSHFSPIFCIFKYIYIYTFFFFSVTSPKAHLLNSRQKPCFYQWGPFKSAKPFWPWRWLRSIGTYESYHKQSQRLHISLPSQNYEYSSSLISVETNRVLADKEMHKTPNTDISISCEEENIHNFFILHIHS